MSEGAAERVVACVAVRMKSTRLPQKALADVAGLPLIRRLIERVAMAEEIDQVVLCTSTHPDDRVLLELADEWGIPSLAGSEEDVLARVIQAAEQFEADVVIRVTGDNLFTDPEYLDRIVRLRRATGAEYARANGLPLGVTGESMARTMLGRLRARIPAPSLSEYMMLYAFDPAVFRCAVVEADQDVRRPHYSLTVDTPADLALVRKLFAEVADVGYGPRLADVVALLDHSPDVRTVAPETLIKLPLGRTISYADLLTMLDRRAAAARAETAPSR